MFAALHMCAIICIYTVYACDVMYDMNKVQGRIYCHSLRIHYTGGRNCVYTIKEKDIKQVHVVLS